MSRFATGLLLAGLLAMAGCTGPADYLEVARAQQKAMEEVTNVLRKIDNEKDMAAARDELEERFARYDAIARKARDLPKPAPPEVGERMQEEGFERAIAAMQREISRVRNLPGGKEFFDQFKGRTLFPGSVD